MRISKIDSLKLRVELAQFVLALNPQTLLTIDMVAPVINKSPATFAIDVTRRPNSLPRLTRIGRRVFVRVADLLEFISASHPQQPQPQSQQPRRGRPTKAEQAARLALAEGGAE